MGETEAESEEGEGEKESDSFRRRNRLLVREHISVRPKLEWIRAKEKKDTESERESAFAKVKTSTCSDYRLHLLRVDSALFYTHSLEIIPFVCTSVFTLKLTPS